MTSLFNIAMFFILSSLPFPAAVEAQPQSAYISGEVRDQRGDLIAGAQVSLTGSANSIRNVESDAHGRFRFDGLMPGEYLLKVAAQGFAAREERMILMNASATRRLTITLYPAIRETLDISDDQKAVSINPDRAAGAQVLKEEQLRLAPDDPDQLFDFLQLLSTSSGSAPGQASVTVDGFTHEGRLPPKSAIREVRINSNIFSAEYDKPPYRGGRIDIYAKPGASAFHGSGSFNFNAAALNARDVFAPERAPVKTRRYGLQFGGPVIRQRAGFQFDFEARDINEASTVNAVALDHALNPASFTVNVATPKLLLIGSARADWQATPSHAFIARYDVNRDHSDNQGVGGFDLPSRAYDGRKVSRNLRFSGTSVINKNLFNEARLGLTFNRITQRAASAKPAITALGAFTDGGASIQSLVQDEWGAEFTDNLSYVTGHHSLKFGAQIFGRSLNDAREENFNGAFVFGGAVAPPLDADGRVIIGAEAVNISGLEQYRRALLGLPGGAPTRFSISRGNSTVAANQWTLAGFVQDEWSLRQDLLLSLGLRYEAQTNPSDGISLGPRVGVGYSPDKKRHWVMRARLGLFYDRIAIPLAMESLRFDGRHVQRFIIDSPSFPDPFKGGAAVEQIPAVRRFNPALRPPTSFQAQAGFERQFGRGWKLDVSHYWSRSWAALRSRNLNAPIVEPGGDPLTAPRPFGVRQNILQFESSGSLTGRVLFVGVNQSSHKRVNIFSGYLRFDFRTDADQPFHLPQSSYDMSGEWARPFWQATHRGFLVALINLPGQWRASSELNLASGTPFNITTGRDNNGDGNFNDRPSVTGASNINAIVTRFGALDPSPINGSMLRNSGMNPFNATLDFNLSRTFRFGGRSRPNERRFQMTFNARANNLLNRANLSGVDGALNSPFFGRSNSALPARRVELGVRLEF
ncbi:MAG TPA: TonB-dependent receptor [Blastocatellia bacterium]|nr:TonB-dependent receptor [Blastocatellia bacterium]